MLLTRRSFTVSQIFHAMLSDKPRAKMLIGFLYSLLLAVACVWEMVLKVLCNYTCLTAQVKIVNLLSQVLRREKNLVVCIIAKQKLIFIMDSWIRCHATAGVHLNRAISNLCVVKLAVLLENVTPLGVTCASFVDTHMKITVFWLFWRDLCGCAKNYCALSTEVTLPVLLKVKLTSLDELTCLEAFVLAFFWTEELC